MRPPNKAKDARSTQDIFPGPAQKTSRFESKARSMHGAKNNPTKDFGAKARQNLVETKNANEAQNVISNAAQAKPIEKVGKITLTPGSSAVKRAKRKGHADAKKQARKQLKSDQRAAKAGQKKKE